MLGCFHYGSVYPIVQVAYTGSVIAIKCFSKYIPKWTRKDGMMQEEAIYSRSLILMNVQEKDSGIYMCYGSLINDENFYALSELLVGGM